jgi:hypothetical protein
LRFGHPQFAGIGPETLVRFLACDRIVVRRGPVDQLRALLREFG